MIELRKTKPDELNAIIELAENTQELHDMPNDSSFLSKDILKGYIKSKKDIFESIYIDDELSGFIICQVNEYTKVAYLEDFVITHEKRGNGYGEAVYKMLITKLKNKGVTDIWALVHEQNNIMLSLLKKHDFSIGRKFYLVDKEIT